MPHLTPFALELVRIAGDEYRSLADLRTGDAALGAQVAKYCQDLYPATTGPWQKPFSSCIQHWSAAFVSWCIRQAGARDGEFKFSAKHAVYVNWAILNAERNTGLFRGYPIDVYAPKPGDLVSFNRDGGKVTFEQARNEATFDSHSAIVVDIGEHGGEWRAIVILGNNSDGTVGREEFELDASGRLQQRAENPFICLVENLK